MVCYNYRWVFAVGISLLLQSLGYFYVLSLPLNEMMSLRKQEKDLIKKVQALNIGINANVNPNIDVNKIKNANHSNDSNNNAKAFFGPKSQLPLSSPKNKFDIVADIVKLFKKHHLNVISVKLLQKQATSSSLISIDLVMYGEFQQLISFLFENAHQSNAIQLLDFSSQSINSHANQLRTTMALLISTTNQFLFFSEQKRDVDNGQKQLFCPPEGFHLDI